MNIQYLQSSLSMKTENNTRKKRLLIVNDLGISRGGTQKRVSQLIKGLIASNIFEEIFVVAHVDARIHTKKIPEHVFCVYSTKEKIRSDIKTLIQEKNISHVQVHNLALLSTEPIKVAKEMSLPVIFFAHDYWPICGRRSFYAYNKKICLEPKCISCNLCIGPLSYFHLKTKIQSHINMCDVGIATSNYMIDTYEKAGILKEKWEKLTPWIREEYLQKRIQKRYSFGKQKKILYVGTLDKEKGFFDLLNVFVEMCKKRKDLLLIAIGDVSQRNIQRIQDILIKENITPYVSMPGYIENGSELLHYYLNADLYVFPSLLNESFGQTWVQALACGTPIVAYDSGSVKEFLKEYGMLITLGDKEQLNKVISSFFNDPFIQSQAKEKARFGKKYAQSHFSLKKSFNSIKEIYNQF